MLREQGYNTVSVVNTWRNNRPYKGINTTVVKDGQMFELQFHTRQSYNLKNGQLHTLYERFRLPETPETEREMLKRQTIELSRHVPNPKGVGRIKMKS